MNLQPISWTTDIRPSDLSDDASTIVATSSGASNTSPQRPLRITDAGRTFPLLGLDGSPAVGTAERISGDGRIIAGNVTATPYPEPVASGPLAVRWIDDGLPVPLIELTDEITSTFAVGMTEDGSIVTGAARDSSGLIQAFVWSEIAGIQFLGNLGGESPFSVAVDATPDGRLVVGFSTANAEETAFIWDREHGIRALDDVLRERGVELKGWQLWSASSISDDGRTIMGGGLNPNGDRDTFVVNIPPEKTYIEPVPKPCRPSKADRRRKARAGSKWSSEISPCRPERRSKWKRRSR